MPDLKPEEVERYLQSVLGTQVLSMAVLGGDHRSREDKGFGYFRPVRVDVLVDGHERRTAVLHIISPAPFGHEHMADCAQELILGHHTFNRLPRHVRSLDVYGFQSNGHLLSIGNVEEFSLLADCAGGETYSHDLERLRDTGRLVVLDYLRADALCDYLVSSLQKLIRLRDRFKHHRVRPSASVGTALRRSPEIQSYSLLRRSVRKTKEHWRNIMYCRY